MQIGKDYILESDQYQWILKTRQDGKDKDGNPKDSYKYSYHRTLDQVAARIVNRESKSFESLGDLLELLPKLIGDLSGSINKQSQSAQGE